MGLSRDAALYDWFDELPCVFGINETHLGRIANIGLPRLRSRLYDDQSDLVTLILEALEISHRIGARVVSLTGLLPSATNYGQAIADVISANDRYPLVTTGHATTVSTVVMTIERILREAGKSLAEENVAFLGLGSIGYTTLRLMLHSLPHPKSITLCDIYSKLDHLKKVRDDLIRELKFAGLYSDRRVDGKVPHEVYDAGLIVGATNVPDVLDIEQLRPGTVIVDDSAPHCFNPMRLCSVLKPTRIFFLLRAASFGSRNLSSELCIYLKGCRTRRRRLFSKPYPNITRLTSAVACYRDC